MTIDLSRTAPSTWTLVIVRPGAQRETRTFADRDAAHTAYGALRAA